jgi:hypothetical protein
MAGGRRHHPSSLKHLLYGLFQAGCIKIAEEPVSQYRNQRIKGRFAAQRKRSCAEMEHYAGLDVALRATAVCVIDERGRAVIEGKFRVNPTRLPTSCNRTPLRSNSPALRRACSHRICITVWSSTPPQRAPFGSTFQTKYRRPLGGLIKALPNKPTVLGLR